MKNITARLVMATALMIFSAAIVSQANAKMDKKVGAVKEIDMENRTVTITRKGQSQTIHLPEKINIRSRKAIELSDISEGANVRAYGAVSEDQSQIKTAALYQYDSKGNRLDDNRVFGAFSMEDGQPVITAKGKKVKVVAKGGELSVRDMRNVEADAIQEGQTLIVRGGEKDGKWFARSIIINLPKDK